MQREGAWENLARFGKKVPFLDIQLLDQLCTISESAVFFYSLQGLSPWFVPGRLPPNEPKQESSPLFHSILCLAWSHQKLLTLESLQHVHDLGWLLTPGLTPGPLHMSGRTEGHNVESSWVVMGGGTVGHSQDRGRYYCVGPWPSTLC